MLWKSFIIFAEGKNAHCENSTFIKKIKDRVAKTLYYILILKINNLVIKLLYIVRLTALDIHISVVAPIVMFAKIFDECVIYHGILNGVLIIYIYIYTNLREN